MSTLITDLGERLDDAARDAREIEQLTQQHPALTEVQAYAIQSDAIARRVARGAQRIGMKMGFTSRAKMAQMGVHDMIWGRLTADMLVEDGGSIPLHGYVHPRCEPEIAFLLGRDLPAQVTPAQALAAVEAVAPALEIIDSRYRDFKFTLADVIADNCSSAGLVVGSWADPRQDLSNLGLVFSINGQARQIGSTAAILGHPLRSLVAAARLSAAAGEPLRAGWIVMAGGATAAEALSAGDHVQVEVQSIGGATFTVEAN